MSKGADRLYPDGPMVGCLAVVRRGERILLAQRSVPPGVGRWGFPGGKQELGETLFACARRELLEETGIAAEPVKVLGAFDAIRRDDDGRVKAHFSLVAVLLDWRQGEGAPIEDASALLWATPAELEARSLPLFDRVQELMALALAR